MKKILMSMIFISVSVLSFANGYNESRTKYKSIVAGSDFTEKETGKRVCEKSQSGTISTYLTSITITCTSIAPTCEQAEKSAKDCAERFILDAFTKVKVTMS